MLPFIQEQTSLWEHLQTTTKPLVLYGMGNGADKIITRLEALGKKPAAIFASTEFVRGQHFHGYTVQTYQEVTRQFTDCIILIAFASELPEVLARFQDLDCRHETYAPHVPIFPEEETVSRPWLERYAPLLQQVYDRLADDKSRQVFAATLNYKLSGKLHYLLDCTTSRAEDLGQLFTFTKQEVYADLGAYNGDTIQEFLRLCQNSYQAIYAVEADAKNFQKLTQAAAKLQLPALTCLHKGIWSQAGQLPFSSQSGRQASLLPAAALGPQPVPKSTILDVDSLDHLLAGDQATYIKIDVEGAEAQAIQGAARQLAAGPKLLIAAYHHDEDLFTLPRLLWQLQPGYKLHLRKHPYVPAWELNYFASLAKATTAD